eukprot:TRINITY_DN15457_c0_g1_i1.p1 TRINITY_DN15457_c0_g1~~TRINITY_DN15457_c0_g1_i1.p1  ORF type:complete len:380 (-),score=69.12 TRINITY_DN15457_c0_g1_i1:294-1433(-)
MLSTSVGAEAERQRISMATLCSRAWLPSNSIFCLPSQLTSSSLPSSRNAQTFLPIYISKRKLVLRHAVSPTQDAAGVDPRDGVPLYKPNSYQQIVEDAARALMYALDDGKTRLEIEFPSLPTSISSYKGSSDEFIDANIQLALALARRISESRQITSRIIFPDRPEKRRAARIFQSALNLITGISIGSLDDVQGGTIKSLFNSIRSTLDMDFGSSNEGKWESAEQPSLYVFVNCSTRELVEVEQYVDAFAKETPVLLFNLELDTLRSDLGLLGFPPRELHYRFLCKFLPVYYIRTRDYSKTVAAAPFVLNYSGALFRQYPGPWQVMLKQSDGSYACVAESAGRFTLGQTKEELLRVLGIQEKEGSSMAFLRQGYKEGAC